MSAAYAYDPLGRRVSKTGTGVSTLYFLNAGSDEIAEYTGSGALSHRNIPGPAIDEPVATMTASNAHHYPHPDHHGSLIEGTDSGSVTDGPFTYDPYGNCSGCSSGTIPYRYVGMRLDQETGLYYDRARYYAPAIGRFLQTDPVGYTADLNLYTYGANDPSNMTDPTGNDAWGGGCPPRTKCGGDSLGGASEGNGAFQPGADISNDEVIGTPVPTPTGSVAVAVGAKPAQQSQTGRGDTNEGNITVAEADEDPNEEVSLPEAIARAQVEAREEAAANAAQAEAKEKQLEAAGYDTPQSYEAAREKANPDPKFQDMMDRLTGIGGGAPRSVPTAKGASQFIYPNGTVLRFDLEPGQYLNGQDAHINLQNVPGAPNPNYHINLKPPGS